MKLIDLIQFVARLTINYTPGGMKWEGEGVEIEEATLSSATARHRQRAPGSACTGSLSKLITSSWILLNKMCYVKWAERETERERKRGREKSTAQKSATLPRAARVPLATDVATNIRKWAEGSVRERERGASAICRQMLKCWLKVCPACRKFVAEMKLTICSVFRLKMALSGRRKEMGERGRK